MSRDLDGDFTDRKTDWDTVRKPAKAKSRNIDMGRQPKQETASGQLEDTIREFQRVDTREYAEEHREEWEAELGDNGDD